MREGPKSKNWLLGLDRLLRRVHAFKDQAHMSGLLICFRKSNRKSAPQDWVLAFLSGEMVGRPDSRNLLSGLKQACKGVAPSGIPVLWVNWGLPLYASSW